MLTLKKRNANTKIELEVFFLREKAHYFLNLYLVYQKKFKKKLFGWLELFIRRDQITLTNKVFGWANSILDQEYLYQLI